MKRKITGRIALPVVVLVLVALAFGGYLLLNRQEDQTRLIDELNQENQALHSQVKSLQEQLNQIPVASVLEDWSVHAVAWENGTGADVTFTATPLYYHGDMEALLLVTLDGQEVASTACDWDGMQFTATVSLEAADGYSYFCLLTGDDGQKRLCLMAPDSESAGLPVYLQSALSTYCNLVVNDWQGPQGISLVLTDAYAQVQLPQLRAQELTIASQKLVLRLNGAVSDQVPIEMVPSEVAGSFELVIQDLSVSMPQLNGGDNLELYLEITLSDGSSLQAQGISWYLENGKLCSSVG